MAFRTWGRVLLAALGAGLLAGAGQLGVAYGLGVVRFARVFDVAADARWAAQLAWVTWFAIVAAVAGATAGAFAARRHGLGAATLGARLALAGAAAAGALAVAPLCMQPARAAQLGSGDPVLTAGLAAGLGALVGLFAALAALSQRPVGWNIAVAIGGIWLVTLLSVAPSLGPTDPLPDVRLGVLDPASLGDPARARLAILTLPALALVAGVVSGGLARSRDYSTLAAAGSGAVGPGLAALAYLAAGSGGADAYQAGPYWGSLIATGAGALGSVLASVLRVPARSDAAPMGTGVGVGPEPATPDTAADAAARTRGGFRRDRGSTGDSAAPADRDPGSTAADRDPASTAADRDPGSTAADRDPASTDRSTGGGRGPENRPVAARDEEYVDWVSGLSGRGPEAGELPGGRRTLRRTELRQID